MTKETIKQEYFDWMYDLMCENVASDQISYRKLFNFLHTAEFRYSIPKDENRAHDGINFRYHFNVSEYPDCDILGMLKGPCSVLEMMVALATRCENIMDDEHYGDRTRQWFWGMIKSLGLSDMTDDRFDHRKTFETIERFLDREYEPNGKGGLFTIKLTDKDLRKVEIWYQMCWYLNTII